MRIGVQTCVTYETKIKTGSPVAFGHGRDRLHDGPACLSDREFEIFHIPLQYSDYRPGRNVVSDRG